MGTFTVTDLPHQTEAELDELYRFGENQVRYHDAIMAVLGEWSRRLDVWLASR